ncbi:BTAD domain-containing putative transcriptional regulator [Nonomuraea sp. SBT364]|uniref:BTAD domain-containing putative transcriptional regulator n=1 Tax=Nonomuraea sp. SBT364 TaxID=1580530 RepID=UPI00066A7163|nr:BTAD domain-containing putative transcriptional regulator [Nonomuraea sp. SBT364]
MRFGILGSTRAWRADGSEVPLGGPARRALLTCLLLTPGQVVRRERLIDILYGERPPGNIRHALQSQVSRLRGHGVTVELSASGYRLAAGPDDVDAHRFLRLAAEGRQALLTDPGLAGGLLREGLSLWRGPAVADLDPAYGTALEERRLEALEDRIEADLLRGAAQEVIPELGELIERHPLRERLRGQLMRALHAEGRQAEALVAFERARRLLAEELGADPSPGLARLHRSLLDGDPPPPVSALSGGPVVRQALPAPLTSFVGRDRDVAAVRSLLGETRLVTLLGPGGAGKTRLAVEVARSYEDVCLASLAPLTDGGAIARTVLTALGVRENGLLGPVRPGGPADESRLTQVIGERPVLLVLDNCEHLVDAAAALAERLLAACPGLRVLATTREPLNVTAEHLWPVRPLAPGDAVRLFTDRASAVRPGFAPGEAVARICAALDGLPLALELAAARTRTHEPAELAGRLAHDDRFRLLSRGSRTADARHQTLRAVVAWSWDLLTADEQAMAGRLTVFSGGATAGAAAHVCALPEAEELLGSLADKSFVEVTGGRYRMLDTIRAFCAERLAGEAPAVRRAHADHFLALAEEADAHLRRDGQLGWLERLAAEHDNLLAALGWAVEAGEVATGMRLLGAMSSYLWMRGMRGAGAGPALALLEAAGDVPDPGLGDDYVLCLLTAASGSRTTVVRDSWERAAETMVAGQERGRRRPLLAFLWPMVAAGSRDPQVTMAVIRQAAASPDPWERAVAGLVWAYPQMAAADFGAAEEGLGAALEVFRALGDRWGAALVLDALAWMASVRGDDATALARIEESVALAEQLGAAEDLADLLCNRGDYRIRDDPAGARADYERAAEVARRVGLPTYVASALRGLGDAAYAEGDLAGARGLYEQALRLADPQWLKSSGSRARLLVGMGKLARAEGDPEAARAAYVEAVEVSLLVGAVPECARPIEALAALETDTSPPAAELAARLLGVAAGIRGTESADPEVARAAATARAVLGEQRYARVKDEGARLGIVEACVLAGVPEEVVAASPLRSIAGDDTVRAR